ncbi:hypothetical protein [Paenibacillus sp. UNC451MF]|uniref:hypothetical protein n=1 Tax=Paenibacillus sp. UNC451MF TaxID=1449063 RepID=UPI00048CABC6|nr:hypothetical protein [Paenibacillus sp. UNC451MF]
MNRIPAIIKMHFRDKWTAFLLPWAILLSSFIVNLFVSYLIDNQEPFYTGGLASIFISMTIIGAVTMAQTFPFALGLSVRRKDYFLGTTLAALIINVVSALLLSIFSLVEHSTDGWRVKMYFFNNPLVDTFNVAGHLVIYLVLLLHLHFLGFAISSIHRRFGPSGLFIFLAAVLVLFSSLALVFTHYQLWVGIALWFVGHFALFVCCMALVIFLYAFVSYALLRRATV